MNCETMGRFFIYAMAGYQSDVVRGMSVTQFIVVGHMASNGLYLL